MSKNQIPVALLLGAVMTPCVSIPSFAEPASVTLQQNKERYVQGVVMDGTYKEPMVGASVAYWKDGKILGGVATDIDGKYTLNIPSEGGEIHFSMVGYTTVIIKANDAARLKKVTMKESAHAMDEVVATGFFQKDKKTFTGAATQITVDDIKAVSSSNLITALATLTPGMVVMENNVQGSNPNQVPELVIRGMSSFSNDGQDVNQPTIILDGTEISMQELYDLDINEVENITVLKDASATALYGSKAANGVIVINRKPIEETKLRINYNFTGNAQFPDFSDYHVLNAADKLEYERLAGLYNAGGVINPDGTPAQYALDELYNQRYQMVRRGQNSDWMKQPARNAFSHNHSVRAYGGVNNLRYELSARYGNTQGVMKDDYRRRYNLGFKLSYFINNKIQLSNRTTYAEVSAKDTPYGSFSQYVQMNPYDAMFNEDGSVNTHLSWDLNNPLYEATLGSYSKNGSHSMTNTTDFRWELAKRFRITGHFTVTSNTLWTESFTSPKSLTYKNETDPTKKGAHYDSNGKETSYNGNLVGSYNRLFADNSLISLNAGWEINHSKSQSLQTQVIGFFKDNLSFPGNAVGYPVAGMPFGSQAETADVGFFGNATYSFRDRYYVDGTIRSTGSSQFGANKRFGTFWSGGLGWNIKNESFLKDMKMFDIFKLRGSMGYTGKVSFSPFQAMTMYQYSNDYEYKYGIGAVPKTIGNDNLAWERTMSYNVGLDLSMFDRRLNLVADYYVKNTKDLLLTRSLPPSTGVTQAMDNMGELRNKGYEIQLDGYIIRKKDLTWRMATTAYHNSNTITKISKALEEINKQNQENQRDNQTPLPQFAEGESLTALKLVRSAGIDPATGKEVYIKRNGELTFDYDSNDKVLIGDTQPSYNGTFSTQVFYKGFRVSTMFAMRFGGWVYNLTRATQVEGADPKKNADSRVFNDRWKVPGDVAMYKDIADTSTPKQTDRFAEEENTVTMQSLNFTYELPQNICQRLKVNNMRFGLNFTDILRLSSIEMERGTAYLYSRGFEFTFNTTF